MAKDRIFRNALIASIAFHLLLFYNWPALKNLTAFKTHDKIEVTYYSVKKSSPTAGVLSKEQKLGKSAVPFVQKPVSNKHGNIGPQRPALNPKISDEKPVFKMPQMEGDRFIRHLPSDEKMLISHKAKDFTDEPAYLNYYNIIRGKIDKIANASKPYYSEGGDVKLVFTLKRDGRLLSLDVQRDKSTGNNVLIEHSLASVRRAAPFPSFDDSMKEEQLTLRLTISFEKQ